MIMKLMDDLVPMRLYSAKKRVMLPVNSKDKKHGSAIFLMGRSMAENQELLNMKYLYKGDKLFRSYYIDRNVADYIDSNAINADREVQESTITEGIMHTGSNIFTFKNVGTMDQQVLNAIFNKDTVDWCLGRLGLKKYPIQNITVYLYKSEDEFHRIFKVNKDIQFYAYTEGSNIHILQKQAYDEKNMDGPYNLYCLHELFYCLIINAFPNVNHKIATCTAMALSGQIEYLREKEKVSQFKYHDSKDKNIDGLYIADVIFGLYKTKGGYGIKKFLEGDLSGFNRVASRRILAWFDTSFKESFAEGTLTAKEKSKLKDSDYGIPSKKKYPMPDESHVRAAIRMFNHCSEEDEVELAKAIKRKIKEYNITDVKISDKNRLSKYVSESMIIKEGYIFNKKDSIYDFEKWKPGSHNVLYITGLSGGGKSTLARELTKKYNAIYIELDELELADEPEKLNSSRADDQLIDEYIKDNPPAKNLHGIARDRYLWNLFKFIRKKMKENSENLYIVEGIQITQYIGEFEDRSILKEPLIIKNTSAIISALRKINRDGDNLLDFSHLDIKIFRRIYEYIDWYIYQEKGLNNLKNKKKKHFLLEYTILDSKEPEPSQMGFYSGEGEKKRWNSIVEIDGKKYRERSEILLIRDGKIFISRQDDGTYKIPGGGTEPNKSCKDQCTRECQEEAFITPKNLKYILTYKDKYPNQSPNNDYVGHVTYLYIGEYDRKFTGNVAPTDKDSRISKGDFFEIEEIYDELIEPHRQGLMKYFNIHEASILESESEDIHTIIDGLSKEESDHIGGGYWVDSNHVIYRKIEYKGKNPIAFIDVYLLPRFKRTGLIVLATSKDARRTGIGSSLVRKAINALKSNKEIDRLRWLADSDNQASISMAKSLGFELKTDGKEEKEFIYEYNRDIKESTTINPDIPYLEYGSNGEPFAANHSESYYNVLEILSTLSFEEFDKISFFSTYKDSDSIKKRIILKDPNGTPMSFMDVYWFPNRPHEAQITTAVSGYYRGHHLCAMMLQQLMDSGFAEEYEIYTYIWNANPENEASKKIALSNGFALRSEDLDEYGRLRYEYHTPLYNKFSNHYLEKLPESTMVLDESTAFIFREADEVEAKYDKKLRRYLYKERLKNAREVLPLYEKVKANNPDIDRVYRELRLYKGQNIYIDVSYYHGLYLQNANLNRTKRNIYMYLDFLTRMMDTKHLKSAYQKFTYFIPVLKRPGVNILDWKSDINIISTIIYLAKKDPDKLRRWGSGKKIVFLGNTGYLMADFSTFNSRNISKFKSHLTKLIENNPILDNELEDDDVSLDEPENDAKGAAIEILGRLEKNKGIKIDDISRIGAKNQIGHLIMNTDSVSIDKGSESTAIMVLSPSSTTFKSEIEDKNLKSKDITICYKPKLGL